MAKTSHRGSRGHGRPTARKPRKKRILVVSGGDVTEREYFSLLNKEFSGFHFVPKKENANPDALAEYAANEKESDLKESRSATEGKSEPYSYVLVVADVDDFPMSQFESARRTCNANNLELVVTNPCFEVWLIDHVKRCPDHVCSSRLAQDEARRGSVVCGRNWKSVNTEKLRGRCAAAYQNALCHNTDERRKARQVLAPFDRWRPWTDMADALSLIGLVR